MPTIHGSPNERHSTSQCASSSRLQWVCRLADSFGIELLWLPKRSPQLNPMDTLWGQAKDVVCADKQYADLDEQVDRFIRHLQGLSIWETLETSGINSDDFWLRDVL